MIGEIKNQVDWLVKNLSKPAEKPKPERFGLEGLLDYLRKQGYTFSKSKLQKGCADKKIPCSKFNNRLVFNRQEIDEWVESQTVKAGSSDVALKLAESANNKLRRGGRKVK